MCSKTGSQSSPDTPRNGGSNLQLSGHSESLHHWHCGWRDWIAAAVNQPTDTGTPMKGGDWTSQHNLHRSKDS